MRKGETGQTRPMTYVSNMLSSAIMLMSPRKAKEERLSNPNEP